MTGKSLWAEPKDEVHCFPPRLWKELAIWSGHFGEAGLLQILQRFFSLLVSAL
jgi:hypothetical protein